MRRIVFALACALVLAGCGTAPPKISHSWAFSDIGCEPLIVLRVEAERGTTVRLLRAAGASGGTNVPFVRSGATLEADIPWHASHSSDSEVEISLERDGKARAVTYRVPAQAPQLHLWHGSGIGTGTPSFDAKLELDVKARPGVADEYGYMDSSRGPARIEPGGLVVDLPVCHVAQATGPDGQIEATANLLTNRIPLAKLLDVRINNSGSKAVRFPVDVRGVDGRNANLVVEMSGSDLGAALLADVVVAPRKGAPAFGPGAPLLLVPEGAFPELIRPSDAALGEVSAVAVTNASSPTVEVCDYARVGQQQVEKTFTRTRHDIAVSVREVRTGRLIASRTFAGSTPGPCPSRIKVEQFGFAWISESDLEGSPPPLDVIRAWLKGL